MTVLLRLPTLQANQQAVDSQGRLAPGIQRALNDAFARIQAAIQAIENIPEIQAALANLDTATQAAQQAASDANAAAQAITAESALQNSYISPDTVLSATATTISVAAHTRYYTDGTSVAVNAGTVAATAAGDTDFVFYDDPARAGGAVTYQVSTTSPTQTGNRHVVGAVMVPAAGATATGGRGPLKPGYVQVPNTVEA